MKKQQDIKSLFNEKLEHFEVAPDAFVWADIKDKLQEKKKKRVIPIWWFYTGIAASFVLGLLLNTQLYPGSSTNPMQPGNNGVTESTSNQEKKNSLPTVTRDLQDSQLTAPETSSESIASTVVEPTAKSKNAVAVNTKTSQTNSDVDAIQKVTTVNEAMAVSADKKGKTSQVVATTNTSDKAMKSGTSSQWTSPKNEPVADLRPEEKTAQNATIGTAKSSQEIVSNNPLIPVKDSTAVAEKPTNELEKLLQEKEKKTTQEQKLNRWQVASNFAPIYFGSLTKGSPLDPSLSENTKQYSAENYSFGVGIGYALNGKWTLRTGINSVRMDYDTEDIAFYVNPGVSSRIQNLSLNALGSNIIIESLNNVKTYNKMVEKHSGALNQRMGYLEVPMEVAYQLGGKKFGFQLVGGVSTFILNQNEVYLKSDEFNLLIGEASNLNTVHFSGNLGLGMRYAFLKNWQARMEPVFKYQINTYRADAGNFKPYMMGLYTGITYTF